MVSKDYQKIIKRLEGLKDSCKDSADVAALQEAMDIISDYEKIVSNLNYLIQKYEQAGNPNLLMNGVYACPECGRRTSIKHSHCHFCGKRLSWNGIRTKG